MNDVNLKKLFIQQNAEKKKQKKKHVDYTLSWKITKITNNNGKC